jgi:hypothetical protein
VGYLKLAARAQASASAGQKLTGGCAEKFLTHVNSLKRLLPL